MEAEREPVRLVADPLQELEPRRVPVEHDRLGAIRDEDLFGTLRERDHGHTRQVEGLHRGQHRRELSLAAVDHHEVRCCRERLVVLLVRHVSHAGEPPRDHLGQRRVVVLARGTLDPELPVVPLLRQAVLEDDHRGDGRLLLDVRDVVALDPQRQALQVERLAELLERLDAPEPLLLGGRGLGLQRDARVLGRQLLEPPLLSPLRLPEPRPASRAAP